jgi:hypothetical protein
MKMNVLRFVLVLVLASAIAAGCSASRTEQAVPDLDFEVRMQVNAAQEFHASLGIENRGSAPFAGDKTFGGEMELRYADGPQAGELRARAEIAQLSKLKSGDTAWPLTWRAHLDPGAYTLTWGAEDYGFSSVEFQIVERDGRLYLDS